MRWTRLKRFFFAANLAEAQLYPPLQRDVRFRPYRPEDHEACLAIYRANEMGRFPEGHITEFEAYLTRKTKTLIVAEIKERVIGYGGLSIVGPNQVVLCYGIVHPEFQGHRIGTTLTLLRLAQFDGHSIGVTFVIGAVDKSMPFYRRLGFREQATRWQGPDGKEYPIGVLYLPDWSLRRIRYTLEKRGIRVEGDLILHKPQDSSPDSNETLPEPLHSGFHPKPDKSDENDRTEPRS